MASCDHCGKEIEFAHICKGCNGRFCTEHKSKSAHDCSALDDEEHVSEHKETFGRRKISFSKGSDRGLVLKDNDRDLSPSRGRGVESRENRHNHIEEHEEEHHYEAPREESRSKWVRHRPDWNYSGPGGANLKVLARFAVLAFIIILMSGAGPFHNDAISTAGQTMWDGIMNMTNSLPDNNTVNIAINTT